MDKDYLTHKKSLLQVLKSEGITFIVLAGFLLKIPSYLIQAFPNKIINIHPALLPKFGGKGMYGMNIHRAVKESQEKETGLTVHYVNENYDEGEHIFQCKCEILPSDSAEDIAAKLLKMEHQHFSEVIDRLLQQ